MAVKVIQVGTNHKSARLLEQELHVKENIGTGGIVFTERLLEFTPRTVPFLNPVNGANMAVDAGFTGIPAFMYESGAASNAISGTTTSQTTNKLNDTGGGFNAAVSVGMIVEDSLGNFAHVAAVDSDTVLSLDADIMGNAEAYTVGEEWPGTIIQGGARWNLTGDISLTNGLNNDDVVLLNNHTSVLSNYVAITGKVTLTTYDAADNSIIFSLALADVLQGNSVDMNNYIDTGLLGVQQNFVIPLSDLGVETETVDEFHIVVSRIGSTKPTLDLDDIQFEKAGGSVTYTVVSPIGPQLPDGTRYHIDSIRLSLSDVLASTVTNGTMRGLAFDQILGVAALTNGIVFQRTQDGIIEFSITLKQLSDFMASGADIVNEMSDGTNTFICIDVPFPKPIILEQGKGTSVNSLTFTISDDLSGLTSFVAVARGATEI